MEKELKEKGPATAALGGCGQQLASGGETVQKSVGGNNNAISLNIPAATEILQNMANLTLLDQHRGN